MWALWAAFVDLMLNMMVFLYQYLGNNFLIALAVFTVVTRLVMLPLNIRQQKSSLRMQEMQPQIQAIQKKHRDNPQKMQEEFAKIGYNPAEPLMGCLPLLIQMPIFFALFRVINVMLEATPQSLIELKTRINPAFDLVELLPIDNTFLWLNLAQPDPYIVLPLLVAASMFVQQKLLSPAAQKNDGRAKNKKQDDNPTAQMQQSMLYTMPVMFGFFSMSFSSGLAIYFVISNLIGIVQGYIVRKTMADAREEAAGRIEASKEAAAAIESTIDDDDDDDDDDGDGASRNGAVRSRRKKKPSRR